MKYVLALVTMLMGAASLAVAAAPPTPKIKVTGVYSSLTYNKEGGDLVGEEVIVGVSREGHYVVFQISEGEPIRPVVVPAKITDTQISFTLPPPMSDWGEFVGQISRDGLIGKFKNGDQPLRLKRKNSYWQ